MSIHRLFQCGLKSPKYSNHRQKAIPYIAVFQSLRSLRTATPSGPTPPGTAAYFNPRGPCGLRRPLVWPRPGPPPVFQSLRSLRTATIRRNPSILRPGNFNPRGPCGPRQQRRTKNCCVFVQSGEYSLRAKEFSAGRAEKQRFLPSSPHICRCEPVRDLLGAWPSH